MNLGLAIVGGIAGIVVFWYVFTIVRGLVRLRPQILVASKKARQQKQSLALGGSDAESVLFKAQRGDAAAQARVGLMFANGDGLPRDDIKAFSWFERAAAAGFVEAQYCLGLAYERGRGVKRDYAKARASYEDAARDGNAAAQCNLGMLHFQGLAGAEDWMSASYWFLKAAAQKNGEAIGNLEWIINHKDSLPAGSEEMILHHRNSAQRGDIDAQFLVAWCYEHGIGVPVCESEALEWYERAMKDGHLYAHDVITRLKTNQSARAANS